MSLSPGTPLGPYVVLDQLGEGGMGEVYRARDTRLDRTVAVKVLAAGVAHDPGFQQRLRIEARAISQLSHPHVCTLYDVGEHQGTSFLVMELLEGDTLAQRLRRQPGHALPPAEGLTIAIQIADALAAAHRRGIVHRDLKPGNVMLAKAAGAATVKLLDFGLARLPRPAAPIADLPTTPPEPMTAEGTVLGTYQYMSPEQVEGVEADARSDIFAFGCVLYEMLAGKPAFAGRSRASVMAAIMERDPVPLATLQPALPPLVAAIVGRCLAKSPDERWQSAADLATALRLVMAAAVPSGEIASHTRAVRRARMAWVVAAVALAALAVAALPAFRSLTSAPAPPLEARFEISLPPDVIWSPSPAASTVQLALAPDGRRLAFVAARAGGAPQIWIRDLASVQAEPVAGTEGATFPFWSARSEALGYFAGGKLKTVATSGGAPQVLTDASFARGGTWNADDVILFSPSPAAGIWRIAASGGAATPVTSGDQDGDTRVYPHFLPDGRHFVFYLRSDKPGRQGIYVQSLDGGDETQVVANDGLGVPAGGRLLFVRDGMLFSQDFNEQTRRLRGDPVRVADGVGFALGIIGYSPVSAAGSTVAFGPTLRQTTALQWHDRKGTPMGGIIARGDYRSPRVSRDGRHAAVTRLEEGATSSDVWVVDLTRGTFSRISHDPATDWFPAWSADGTDVLFGSARARATAIYRKVPGSALPEESLVGPDTARYPLDASATQIVFQSGATTGGRGGYDIGILSLDSRRTTTPFLASSFNEVQGRLSPDGRWLAFASDESGRYEIYVRDFPAGRNQWTISTGGGMQPEWRGDGRELFYVSAARRLMSVPVVADAAAFTAAAARPLFGVDLPEPNAPYPTDYAVRADGQRFLISSVVAPPRPPVTVILNWTDNLRRE